MNRPYVHLMLGVCCLAVAVNSNNTGVAFRSRWRVSVTYWDHRRRLPARNTEELADMRDLDVTFHLCREDEDDAAEVEVMTPEERARNITDQTAAGWSFDGMCACRDSISAAIREAENEALERAALVARSLTGESTREALGASAAIVASQIEKAIRALKG